MSNIVLGKLDIDVLVQLAVLGPMEAPSWEPKVDDADAFGAALWARNYEVAAHHDVDGEVPNYAFAPLPIGVTAGEGLKQVAFYVYQSAGEPDDWAASPLRRQLNRLRHALLEHVPDYRDAPWGWSLSDLSTRAGRPVPPVAVEVDRSAFDGALEHLNAVGLPISDRVLGALPGGVDPRRYLGGGTWPAHYSGWAPVMLQVFTDAEAGELAFLQQAAVSDFTNIENRTLRWGGVVVSSNIGWDTDEERARRLREGIDALASDAHLGPPDEEFSSSAPPIAEVEGEVLATQVLLDPSTGGTHLAEHVVIARTPKQQAELAAMVADPDLRSRIDAVSTRTHSIVLLRGVAEVTRVHQVVQREEVRPAGHGAQGRGTRLSLYTEGATCGYGTVLVIGRLPSTPEMTWIEDPGLRRGIRSSKPLRLS